MNFNRSREWILAAFLIFAAACAGPKIDWQARVGSYTYDQAVLELGPPDRGPATLQDGTKVAEWLVHRGRSGGGFATFGGPYYYGGPFIYHYAEPPWPDRYIRLTFGPDGILKQWQNVAK